MYQGKTTKMSQNAVVVDYRALQSVVTKTTAMKSFISNDAGLSWKKAANENRSVAILDEPTNELFPSIDERDIEVRDRPGRKASSRQQDNPTVVLLVAE